MLTSELYAVFSQLLTGTLTFLTLMFLIWVFRGRWTFLNYFRARISEGLGGLKVAITESKDSWALAIALAVCGLFGLGLVLQTAVDDFVDDSESSSSLIALPVRALLGDETAYRFTALFKEETKCKGLCQDLLNVLPLIVRRPYVVDRCEKAGTYRLTDLGRELANDKRALKGVGSDAGPLQESGRDEWHTIACTGAERFSRKLFYDALNFSIGRDVEGRLLARWQSQIDFLGSTVALAVWALVACAGYGTYARLRLRGAPLPADKRETIQTKCKSIRRVAIVAVFAVYAAGTGYVLAHKSYVERVFGFYSSQIGLQDAFSKGS